MKKLILLLSAVLFVGVIIVQADVPDTPDVPDAPAKPEPPRKAFLGVVTGTVSRSTASQLGITPGIGLTINSVVKGSSADTFGIEKYDILLKMDDQWLTSVSQFTTLLSMKKPGDKTEYTVLRKGSQIVLEVELGSKGERNETSIDFTSRMEDFGERMADFGERMGEFAEKHDQLKKYELNAEQLEETIRSALDQARYRIETIEEDDSTRTSIITGGVRTIISSEDGTLIVETAEEGKSKLLAVDSDEEVVFKGLVSDDGHELNDVDPPKWVKERFLKLKNRPVTISISTTVDEDDEAEFNSGVEWEESGDN